MEAQYKTLTLTKGSCEEIGRDNGFSLDVQLGLSKEQKFIPCKYFYNEEGERLFCRITELEEYYLTNCEFEILEKYQNEITKSIGCNNFNLIEMGAGDGKKTRVLIEHFIENGIDLTYIPIDICEVAINDLIERFNGYSKQVRIKGLVAEYFAGINWLSQNGSNVNLVLFLGSNIGNFNKLESELFLRELWEALNHGDYVLIGFDMKKDTDVLNNAYNDSENVTAEFNLNLLRRINLELGGNFDLDQFKFKSFYNEYSGAVESYLVSQKDQFVNIGSLNKSFFFKKGESIHTENSFKFDEYQIIELAKKSGFEQIRSFSDSKCYFMDSLWRVNKDNHY